MDPWLARLERKKGRKTEGKKGRKEENKSKGRKKQNNVY